MKKEKWKHNGNSYINQKKGWYMSYNTQNINLDNEPELAIVTEGKDKFAILYRAVPEQFEDFENIEDALKFGCELVKEGKAKTGFWSGYDFDDGRWYL